MNVWQQWQVRYSQLSQREKILIFVTGLVVIVFPGYLLWLEPLVVRIEQNQQALARTQQDITTNMQLIDLSETKLKIDPNLGLRKKLDKAAQLNRGLDEQLAEQQLGLIPVEQMAQVLEQVLLQRQGIHLVSMHSLAPQPLLAEGAEASSVLNFYRHGIRLQLRSDYFSLHTYLQDLEQLPQRFLWQLMDYQVADYPTAEVTLEIYTLSSTKDFIRG